MGDISESAELPELQPKPVTPKKSFKIVIISVICVIVLVIAVLLYFFIWKGDSSPEEAYLEMVDLANEGDLSSSINHTILRFIFNESSFNLLIEYLEGEIAQFEYYQTSVNRIEIIPWDEIDNNEKMFATSMINYLEILTDKEVTDHCLLSINETTIMDAEEETSDFTVWCYKIDNEWLIGFIMSPIEDNFDLSDYFDWDAFFSDMNEA